MVRVQHLDHVALSVTDLERSIEWYTGHLGLERLFEGLWDGPPVMLGAGDTCLALFPTDPGPADTASVRVLHIAFRTDDHEAALADLAAAGIPHRAVQHENCRSIYFADPDGHLWEVAFNPEAPLDDNGRMVLPPPKS